MTRTIEGSRSDTVALRRVRRPEHAGPLVERQIGGDNDGAALVTLAEDLEQELRTGRRQRDIAELVDDQQLVGRQLALEAEQSLLVSGLDQLVDHSSRGGEADRQALLTGGQPQSESNVRLASAAVADCDRVLVASNVFAAGEFQDQCLVERRDRCEVETV